MFSQIFAMLFKKPFEPFQGDVYLSHLNIRRKVHITLLSQILCFHRNYHNSKIWKRIWNMIHSGPCHQRFPFDFILLCTFKVCSPKKKHRTSSDREQKRHHRKLQVNGRSILNFHKTRRRCAISRCLRWFSLFEH